MKIITVLMLMTIFTAGSRLMVGPQIVLIVPATVLAGVFFFLRRSALSWVYFGYPLTFGLISARIGCAELAGYEQTPAFAVSVLVGVLGAGLIAAGFWKGLPGAVQ